MSAEFQALRLTAWGLAVLLVWLLFYRWRDYVLDRPLEPGEQEIQPMTAVLVGVTGSGLAALTLLAFTAPLFSGYIAWLNQAHTAAAALAVVVLIGLLVLLIDRVAYHPEAKWRWCAGWSSFVHAMIWGAAWLQA